jgi:DNA-binding helix-hairpin-helix protein with protein kinase domain
MRPDPEVWMRALAALADQLVDAQRSGTESEQIQHAPHHREVAKEQSMLRPGICAGGEPVRMEDQRER